MTFLQLSDIISQWKPADKCLAAKLGKSRSNRTNDLLDLNSDLSCWSQYEYLQSASANTRHNTQPVLHYCIHKCTLYDHPQFSNEFGTRTFSYRYLVHEPGRITATAVLPYRDLKHGTVFLLTFEPQTFQSKHSDIN